MLEQYTFLNFEFVCRNYLFVKHVRMVQRKKNRSKWNLVEFIFILYHFEDHKSFVIIFGSSLNIKG